MANTSTSSANSPVHVAGAGHHKGALVLFSGGQDSTTCLAQALSMFERVETLGFDYGQRHSVEMAVRATVREQLAQRFRQWAPRLGEDHVLSLDVLKQIGGSSLTDDVAFAMQADGLPNTLWVLFSMGMRSCLPRRMPTVPSSSKTGAGTLLPQRSVTVF